MSEDLIRYDILTQEALRAMIAKLLDEVSKTGLPGDHHFFITFDTCAPNVQLSARMKEKYPEEMTIVIQHRFWDMEVTDKHFQIGLSFDEIPELLIIPLAAIKGFYDPSVKFGLQFELQSEEVIEEEPTKPQLVGSKAEMFEEDASDEANLDEPAQDAEAEVEDTAEDETGAQVVSLDSFRKKK